MRKWSDAVRKWSAAVPKWGAAVPKWGAAVPKWSAAALSTASKTPPIYTIKCYGIDSERVMLCQKKELSGLGRR